MVCSDLGALLQVVCEECADEGEEVHEDDIRFLHVERG